MLNLGTGELLVIFLVALIVLGPNRLPDAARQVGRILGELRRVSSGFQEEMHAAMREPTPTLPPLPAEAPAPTTTTSPRRRREPLRADGATPAQQQLSE
jgi:sec-independent protein translocase protein TatB